MKSFKIPVLKFSLCYLLQVCIFHQALASNLLEHEKNNIEIYNRVVPSVVSIKVISTTRYTNMLGIIIEKHETTTSAGIVWNNKGYIITNYHTLGLHPEEKKGMKIRVSFWNDLFIYPASYIDGNPILDIAVLKLNVYPAPLKPIAIGSSADLKVGQEVFSIGHPMNFMYHMSKGIISGINNNSDFTQNLIYTDAFIAIGSSGGPLVNTSGEMVGMNMLLIGQSYQKLTTAVTAVIPIDDIRNIVEHILENNPSTLSK